MPEATAPSKNRRNTCHAGSCGTGFPRHAGSRTTIFLVLALVHPIACKRPSPPNAANQSSQPTTATTAAYIESHNRAVGLMGRFEFDAAAIAFETLAKSQPDDPDIRTNQAIAILNRQREGDSAKALELIDTVLARHPSHARARYCRGILLLHAGKPAEALEAFRAVAAADPIDAYARYHVGQCLLAQNNPAEALPEFEAALAVDPKIRSAYYGAFQCLQRTGKPDPARARLAEFQQLKENPQARLVEFKYTRMGPKAEVAVIGIDTRPATTPPGPLFAQAAPVPISGDAEPPWRKAPPASPSPSITACDIDGDGHVDLFIADAFDSDFKIRNAVLLRRGVRFQLDVNHPLAVADQINAALWGDVDNDGLTDVYFCRRGPNQLWRQTARGRWQDVTAQSRTAAGEFDTVAGALVDADHDGDLDLVLARRDGPTEILSNNLDGTFRAIGGESGVAGDGRPAIGVVVADLDADLDADLIINKDATPHDVWINDRPWKYVPAKGFEEPKLAIRHLVAADADADGQVELYGRNVKGDLSRWTRAANGAWTLSTLNGNPPGQGPLAVADLRGTGDLALVYTRDGGGGWDYAQVTGAIPKQDSQGPSSAWALVNLDPHKGPAVVAMPRDGGAPVVWNPGPGRLPFAALALTGRHQQADQMRSNSSGIGARVAARVGTRWSVCSTYPNSSGPGQSLQPLSIGLGGATKADFISITWPDGLRQTELDVSAGKLTVIPETQRQTSSCPVIFAWNGDQWTFVTDCLGVGGIGFAAGPPGQHVPPRPWENVLLPEGAMTPIAGEYRLKLSEPMEEACYLDQAKLVAYDLPSGWSMTLDERMGVNAPQPTGKPAFFRRSITPRTATNDRGEELITPIAKADHVAAEPGKRDPRFAGFCREHWISMKFDEPIDKAGGEPVLVIDGWVEYPYSQTMFAAWQAGVTYDAPTLEARGPDGKWVVVLEHFGYPAGMPRQISVPIPRDKLPADATELRLRTNLEVYWDKIAVAWSEPCPEAKRIELPLRRATLAETGFARRHTFAQRRPFYDYAKRDPLWDAAHQDGFYTAFGNVNELLTQTDDAVAIFGPGEEIELSFENRAEAGPEGHQRKWVLELAGWCKDRDLYTQRGQTLEPLPTRNPTPVSDRQSTNRDQLHAKYNTRYRAGGGWR